MMKLGRRFVNVLAENRKSSIYSLHRQDVSKNLFYPSTMALMGTREFSLFALVSPHSSDNTILCSDNVGNALRGSNPVSWNSRRLFSSNEKHLPAISDPEIESAFKDLMAASWNELPDSLVEEAKKAVSKATDDKAGQEALKNVFCAAQACEEFSGVLVTLRMALDDLCGLTGENVGPLPGYIEDAVKAAYNRYMTYLESFGPEEHYLRKKVETELGTKMIHLKMRCSGIGSEWGKITLIGTSGISGSYIEFRA